ncbi:MAG: hypothetical protein KDA41_14310 [Planctomycetales bacterium]|nr:hypothetical protein [Planctomycetales bacterium]
MLREIHQRLRPVRRRLRLQRVLPALATGLLLGGWLGTVAGLIALVGQNHTAAIVGLALMAAAPLLLACRALLRGVGWNDAARAADQSLQLEDRLTTALYLASRSGEPDDLARWEMEEALSRSGGGSLAGAVRVGLPWRRMLGGLLLCAVGVGLVAWASLAPPTLPKLRTRSAEPVYDVDVARSMLAVPTLSDATTLDSAAIAPPRNEAAPQPAASFHAQTAGRYFDRLAGQ